MIGKVLLEIGKALGKAVIAGVGVELARVASGHVQKRFGPKKDDKKPEDMTPEELRRDNERLRAENERLRQQRDGSAVPPEVATGEGSADRPS
ncbi:MAG: hypothetical protein IT382_23160 [Deltaproteobacteria bacterium]|nr:hypothetical protein [Deltaproteobacteria bacterium]